MADQRSQARGLAVRCLTVGALVAGMTIGAQAAGATTQTATVQVASTRPWTDTGLDVSRGERVVVVATGTVLTRGRDSAPVTPEGVGDKRVCNTKTQGARPAPTVNCWSLLARVGTSTLFVGKRRVFPAPTSGRLFLGINDLFLADNSGTWNATVVVGSGAVTPSAPVKHSSSSSSSSLVTIIVGALLLIAVIVGIIFGVRALATRRRASHTPEPAPEPALAPAASAAAAAGAEVATRPSLVPTDDDQTIVPGGEDAASVNIFAVELLEGQSLRVGYSFFAEGTEVTWTIRGDGLARTTGTFVTQGGGATQHFVTFPLTLPPELQQGVVTVRFQWTLENVPFEYAVRRELTPADEH